MMRSNITGTTHRPVAWCRSTSSSVASGSNLRRVTTVQAIDAANTNWEKPQAWNIGATITMVSSARHGVRSRIALSVPMPAPPPDCLAPLGDPVVPEVSRIILPLVPVRLGCWPAWLGDEFLDRQIVLRVGPGHDAGGVGFVGQRTVHRLGELLVVDDGVDAFAVDHVGHRRAGERRVEQHDVGADPVGGHHRLDETAVVAAMIPMTFGCRRQGLQRRGQRVDPLVEFAPGQHAQFVDQTGTVRASLGRTGETRGDAHVLARASRRRSSGIGPGRMARSRPPGPW